MKENRKDDYSLWSARKEDQNKCSIDLLVQENVEHPDDLSGTLLKNGVSGSSPQI
ncbi:hypothetical protein HY382_02910 [Candidatus Curtissbacteria bacterium]|nr:hypothetical protein [Candidatus Curtissbacteria bacterium]